MRAVAPARALTLAGCLVLELALLGCSASSSQEPGADGAPPADTSTGPPVDTGAPSDAQATDAPGDARPSDAGSTSVDGASDGPTDGATATTSIVVHYPVPTGHSLTLRGSGGPLNWDAGVPLTPATQGDAGEPNVWTATLSITSPLQIKPLYDDLTWAIGPNWTVTPGVTLDVWPHFFTENGTITAIDNWYSQLLGNARTIWVYTPPSYAENPDERFPVAYFQDGQNDFYDDMSFSGVAWDLQGAMDQGAQDGTIHEAILVGIANAGTNRTWEYTPNPDPADGLDGGGAATYLGFVATELKPAIDMQYPTEPDRANTALCGSSLGGLVSIYGGILNPETFGLIGALSPSTWWDSEWILAQVEATQGAALLPFRVYLDSGNAGVFPQPDPWPAQANYDDWTQTLQLSQAYATTGVDLDYLVQDGGQHSEVYWKERVPGTLAFLFGPR